VEQRGIQRAFYDTSRPKRKSNHQRHLKPTAWGILASTEHMVLAEGNIFHCSFESVDVVSKANDSSTAISDAFMKRLSNNVPRTPVPLNQKLERSCAISTRIHCVSYILRSFSIPHAPCTLFPVLNKKLEVTCVLEVKNEEVPLSISNCQNSQRVYIQSNLRDLLHRHGIFKARCR